MKQNNNSSGFTLMEILVAINISAVSILLVVSFSMFAMKYLNSLKAKYEKNWDYNSFYLSLSKTLKNDSILDFSVSGTDAYLITPRRDTIKFQPEALTLKNIFKLEKLGHISLEIRRNDKLLASYNDGNTLIDGIKYGDYHCTFKFEEIVITTSKDSINKTFNCLVPAISGNKFTDIQKDAI
jgi:hypothetical protein